MKIAEGKNTGKTCRVHYKGTFNDGSQFDITLDANHEMAGKELNFKIELVEVN